MKELIALEYAERTNRKLVKMLGKGAFGEAYLMDDGHVAKITNDACEALASCYMKGERHPGIVETYEVELVKELYVIEQEKLLHNVDNNGKCDEIFWILSDAADREGVEITEMIRDMPLTDIILQVSDESVVSVVESIKDAMQFFDNNGFSGEVIDLASDNYGFTDAGECVVFDARASEFTQQEAGQLIAEKFPWVVQREVVKQNNTEGMHYGP